MKRLVMMVLVLVAVGGTTEVNAQSFLKKLGKKVENAAKNAIERNAERKTEEAVDKVFEGDFGKGKKDKDKQNNNGNNNADAVYDNGNGDATAQSGQQTSDEMAWNKTDFVAGDEIIFEDLLVGEKLGEFPSMWDLVDGNAEIGKLNGENIISMTEWTKIAPLMKDMNNYLSESFTIEFEFYVPKEDKNDQLDLRLLDESGKRMVQVKWLMAPIPAKNDSHQYTCYWTTTSGAKREATEKMDLSRIGWHKFALSFNKRALKIYIDGIRVTNVPNVAQATSVLFLKEYGPQNGFIKNIRIAKGAVPLYDRMMSDGKFITYGITFDVGKATIKPESMGEINRIVQLMTENPDLKFSVEGHTDNTGKEASNQTLSEQRSQAIVAKLVELGIAQDRLTAVGKGQNSPIADNNTDEGRAKNRRVEFVKM